MRKGILFCVCLFLLGGCSSITLQEVETQYYQGDAKKAYALTQKALKEGKDALLWQIQGGIIGFDLEQAEAKSLFEQAENRLLFYQTQGLLSGFFQNLGAILLNDEVLEYQGLLYEGVMINYYKAMLEMAEKNYAQARVELNRASYRQKRIKEYYEEEIKKTKLKEEEFYKGKDKSIKIEQNKQVQEILKTYSNLTEFSALKGYINPMVDYLSGIFFLLEKDWGKSIDFLKEAYGVSGAKIIAQDLEMAQKGGYQERQTWVILEDGKGPYKIERKFFVPFFISDHLLTLALAFPEMKGGVGFAQDYQTQTGIHAEQISELSALAIHEFNTHLPFIITRGIISASSKAVGQYFAQNGDGFFGALTTLGSFIYTALSTRADLRASTLLPKRFYVLRVKNSKGEIQIKARGKIIARFELKESCDEGLCVSQDHILYVRNAQHNQFQRVLYSK